jgi:spore maturation protein CgeB
LSYLDAFRQFECELSCFDMAQEYEKSSWLTKNWYTNRIICLYAAKVMNKKLLEAVESFNPELIFIHKGQWIFPETLRKIKTNGQALLFIFNPDNPFNPNRGASSEFIRNSIPIYDIYFIWSKALIPRLEQAGARQVDYLPFAADPKFHHLVTLTKEDRQKYSSDVVFIGNFDKERERWLSELEGYDLAIWGGDYWVKRCKNKFLRFCWKGKTAIGEEMSKIAQSSKINLNILRLQNKGSHNMRSFEIPACGGFMLHERSDEASGFFKEGEDAAYFDSVKTLRDKIEFYLDYDKERIEIARSGNEKCKNNGYSYCDRVKQVLMAYDRLRGI